MLFSAQLRATREYSSPFGGGSSGLAAFPVTVRTTVSIWTRDVEEVEDLEKEDLSAAMVLVFAVEGAT